jgi:probable HAF family extracellular repeat protein
MVTRSLGRLIVVTSLALAATFAVGFDAAGRDAVRQYVVKPLPSLGGASSRGNGINDRGLIAGFSNLPDNTRRAVVWLHGFVQPLGTFGGSNSSVAWSGQNNRGLVVGIAQTAAPQTRADGWSCRAFFPGPDNTKFTCLGFAWEFGRMRPLPTLGGDNGFAASANNRRQIVGWAENRTLDTTCAGEPQPQFRAALWDLNTRRTHELIPLGDESTSAATAINDRGQVVGISGDCDQSVGRRSARHAVLWEHGVPRELDDVGGDTWNTPTAITERGDIIVGFASSPNDDPDAPMLRAVVWTTRDDFCPKLPGKNVCDLGTLDAGGTAQAWGVNERGQVVGTSCPPAGACKAFLWESGVMSDFNMSKGDFPHHLESAMDINNLGRITGRAVIGANQSVGFVAAPKRP